MPAYDINGATLTLSSLKNINGGAIDQAYNINGVGLYGDLGDLVVMTYNVQRFRGINSQQAMQDLIISKYNPDIIGIQELSTDNNIPAVGESMLANYPIRQKSNHQNFVLMATKTHTLSNVVIADYTNQDPQDLSQWNETRAYEKADITVNGKTISWFNTHLCYLTQSVKWQQMGELFTLAEQCPYAIITGDFNSMIMSAQADDYINMYKQFVDAGYNLANNSPIAGFHNTFTNATTATSLADLTQAPDSIITTSNIDILSVVFDDTKLSYLNGSEIDHIAVIASLKVN